MPGVLQEPLKIALGEEATTQIFTLTNSTAKMLEKLQHLTMVYKTGQRWRPKSKTNNWELRMLMGVGLGAYSFALKKTAS